MTAAPVEQSHPARLDQVAGNRSGHVQGADVQRLGPDSTPARKGSASGPPTATLPPVPVSKQGTASDYGKVTAALDKVQPAAAAFYEASRNFNDARRAAGSPGHEVDETELAKLEDLKVKLTEAYEKMVRAQKELKGAVSTTINTSSCASGGKCNFSSAQKAAEKLDADVSSAGNRLQTEAKITKDEARDRQQALRVALNSVLADLASDSLRRLIDGQVKAQDRNKLVKEVAWWVAKGEEYPAATNQFGHLKPIVESLKANSTNKPKTTALINDLLAACEKQGMVITNDQKNEIGVP
jgi:hypothetical protein